MSTGSTGPAEAAGERQRSWVRTLAAPVAAAIVLGAVGGGAFYYFVELRGPGVRRTNPAAARRVATTHVLVTIDSPSGESSALAMIGRTREGAKVLSIQPTTIVEVPGIGPRSIALALRQSGAEGTAVAVANALRIMVPSVLTGSAANVAATVDAVGGVTVTVPKTLKEDAAGFTRTVFGAGPAQMTGDAFVRYMTASFLAETGADRDNRQQAGWRALLTALTKPEATQALTSWSTDIPQPTVLSLLRSCAQEPAPLSLPVTSVGLAGEKVGRIDEGQLPVVRRQLADYTNGAETLDGRRVRLVVGVPSPVGPIVGRILVNAGYLIALSGKSSVPAVATRVAVSPTVTDAEATGKDIAGLLGMGVVRVSTDSATDADIILTIGMDWANANGFRQR
jgi:hypothetical protein